MKGVVDIHAHYVSPRIIEAARREPGRFGVEVVDDQRTGWPRFLIEGEEPSRPTLPAMRDLAHHRAFAAENGLDGQVLSIWPDLVGYTLPEEKAVHWNRLLNEAMADDLREAGAAGPLGFAGFANVPLHLPELAARELVYAVEQLGLKGVQITTHVEGVGLDDPRFDPFWEACAGLEVPVLIHPFKVGASERLGRYYLHNVVGYTFETTVAAGTLIYGGVLDRFPKLTVILVHGGGYLPYQLARFDRAYTAYEVSREKATARPSTYPRRFYYDTLLHDAAPLRFLIERVGSDRVVLGSDFPFGMMDPHPAQVVRALGLPEEQEQQVLGGNARVLLKAVADGR